MAQRDIPAVLAIEREAFPTGLPPTAFDRELQNSRLTRYLVAVEHETPSGRQESPVGREQIVGFLGLWLMVGEGHIVSIAVKESHRQRGIGELLIMSALDIAAAHHLEIVTLECRVSNTAAQRLYEKYGFRRVGLRPRYYTDNNEDAVVMTTPPLNSNVFQRLLAQRKAAHRERWGITSVRNLGGGT